MHENGSLARDGAFAPGCQCPNHQALDGGGRLPSSRGSSVPAGWVGCGLTSRHGWRRGRRGRRHERLRAGAAAMRAAAGRPGWRPGRRQPLDQATRILPKAGAALNAMLRAALGYAERLGWLRVPLLRNHRRRLRLSRQSSVSQSTRTLRIARQASTHRARRQGRHPQNPDPHPEILGRGTTSQHRDCRRTVQHHDRGRRSTQRR